MNNVHNLLSIDKNNERYNLIIIPNDGKLDNLDNMFNEIFKNIYLNIKQEGNNCSGFINNFLLFERGTINGRFKCKAYMMYPNINFQIKRISKHTLANNAFNKCLLKKNESRGNIEFEMYSSGGYIGMTREHRIVCLPDREDSFEQTIFGIWMNIPDDTLEKNPDDRLVESFIRKNRFKIYEKCLKFIMKSSKINIINSPSPNEGVFLFIMIVDSRPFYFEIKTIPNDKETIFRNFGSEWLITRKEYTIDRNFQDIKIEFNCENKNGFVTESISRYLNGGSFANILQESTRSRKTFDDPLVEMFEHDDEEEINFPLQRNRMRSDIDNNYFNYV